MHLNTYLFIILLIIIIAAIFVPQFQKLIFESDAEATVSDRLSIKGKMFATLCLAIVAAMVFVFYLDQSERVVITEQEDITVDYAIGLLNDSFDLRYQLAGNQIQGKYEADENIDKTVILGTLNSTPERRLNHKKSNKRSEWLVTDEDFTIGQLKHDVNLKNYAKVVLDTFGYDYRKGITNVVGDGRLRFRIDSIIELTNNNSHEYYLSFGEKQDDDTVIWKKMSEPIPRSRNGKIEPNNRKRLWQQNWKNDYIIDIGIGAPTSYNGKNSGVDLLNIKVAEITFD